MKKQILYLSLLIITNTKTQNLEKIPLSTSLEKLIQDAHISTKEKIQKQGTGTAIATGVLLFIDSKSTFEKISTNRSFNPFSLLFYTACSIGAVGVVKITFDYLHSLYAAREALYHFSNAKKELYEIKKLVKELKEKNTAYEEKQKELETILVATQNNAAKARESMELAEKNIQKLISKLSTDMQNVAYTIDVDLLRLKIGDLELLLNQLCLSQMQQAINNNPDMNYIEQQVAAISDAAERFGKTSRTF